MSGKQVRSDNRNDNNYTNDLIHSLANESVSHYEDTELPLHDDDDIIKYVKRRALHNNSKIKAAYDSKNNVALVQLKPKKNQFGTSNQYGVGGGEVIAQTIFDEYNRSVNNWKDIHLPPKKPKKKLREPSNLVETPDGRIIMSQKLFNNLFNQMNDEIERNSSKQNEKPKEMATSSHLLEMFSSLQNDNQQTEPFNNQIQTQSVRQPINNQIYLTNDANEISNNSVQFVNSTAQPMLPQNQNNFESVSLKLDVNQQNKPVRQSSRPKRLPKSVRRGKFEQRALKPESTNIELMEYDRERKKKSSASAAMREAGLFGYELAEDYMPPKNSIGWLSGVNAKAYEVALCLRGNPSCKIILSFLFFTILFLAIVLTTILVTKFRTTRVNNFFDFNAG
ncbi:hypothetical protein SNEBB_009492 [Seison nebaliae]|nr:hypothetical protein SNEBB_009492 [Seison nebaliae]